MGRPTKSRHSHMHKHNDAVNRQEFCAICHRSGDEYLGKAVKRGAAINYLMERVC